MSDEAKDTQQDTSTPEERRAERFGTLTEIITVSDEMGLHEISKVLGQMANIANPLASNTIYHAKKNGLGVGHQVNQCIINACAQIDMAHQVLAGLIQQMQAHLMGPPGPPPGPRRMH